MVVLRTIFCLELGNEIEHQVRARARSGRSSLTLMRHRHHVGGPRRPLWNDPEFYSVSKADSRAVGAGHLDLAVVEDIFAGDGTALKELQARTGTRGGEIVEDARACCRRSRALFGKWRSGLCEQWAFSWFLSQRVLVPFGPDRARMSEYLASLEFRRALI